MADLPRVPYGKTGMSTTRVGLGTWAMGGLRARMTWGPQDDDDSVATILRAVSEGVNWIDTAAQYGLGHAEEIVGRALRRLPETDRPYVFTKCGLRWDEHGKVSRVGRPESIRWEVEQSLRRLGVERIDLYQMHWPPRDGTPVEDYWAALLELKAEGTIRAAGLSNHDTDQLERAERVGPVDSLQPPLSAIDRAAAGDVIPWCQQRQVAVIVYSPMQNGLLSGGFDQRRVASLPERDWRRADPQFTGDALRANLAVAAALAEVAGRHGVSTAAAAVAWTLAVPGVTGAIVGARRPEQLAGWLPAAGLALTPADLALVADTIERSGAGTGPQLR